jgi:hypothetical protein
MSTLRSVPHNGGNVRCLLSGGVRLISILCIVSGAAVASGDRLVDQDTDMQAIFFLDKFAVSQTIDMRHRFFQPERVDGLIALDNGKGGAMAYFNVFYDQDPQVYKAWYKIGSAGCYAESRDGIHWDNPDLSEDTGRLTPARKNAVFSGEVEMKKGVVTYDPYDADDSRRYKIPYEENKESMRMAYSPDGIIWRIDPGPSWHPGVRADTGNEIIYNPFSERYQIFTRASSVDRRIAMIETEDLKTWSDPRVILHPSPLDPVGMEFYGMPVRLYEDVFLGLLWKFQTGTAIKGTPRRNDGIIEPELAYSYDGVTWNRTYSTFIERSQRGGDTGARIYPESILIDHEGGIRLYSRGYAAEHGSENEDKGKVVVVLHKMRRDGFAGMESFGIEGYLKTKQFVLKGDELALNVNAPYGSVKVQISGRSGKPYPGFSFDDCVEWSGDDVFYHPQWKDKNDLGELVGEDVRFEIKLKEGILYAIRASLNPSNIIPPMKRY